MATGKSSAGKSSPKKSAQASKSATRASSQGKRGPAQRPPARRKKKSIVNQKQTPWGLIATVAAVAVFAAAIIVFVVVHKSGSDQAGSQILPSNPAGATTTQKAPKQVANSTGIKGVLAWDTEGWPGDGKAHAGALQHDHVDGQVSYSITPPVGGPHNATWMNAGVYTDPIPSERAVHNLEHGAVWITYRPGLSASKVAALKAFVGKQSMITESAQATGLTGQANRYIDLSPWISAALPAPIVMSSWGYQLRLSSPTDPRMQKFIDIFRNSSKYTPEFGSAVDGIPVDTGGRPAAFGSKIANPAGTGAGGGS